MQLRAAVAAAAGPEVDIPTRMTNVLLDLQLVHLEAALESLGRVRDELRVRLLTREQLTPQFTAQAILAITKHSDAAEVLRQSVLGAPAAAPHLQGRFHRSARSRAEVDARHQ